MRRISDCIVVMLATVLLIGCGGNFYKGEDRLIAMAVESQLALYPEATLQDLYKCFFQAELGSEHLIKDTLSAGRYLDMELKEPDSSNILFEPIGVDSSYYRVHLKAVQDGLITRDELFHAFVGSAHMVDKAQLEQWKGKWAHVVRVIEQMNLNLVNFECDRQRIDSLLSQGQYTFHHSEHFGRMYKPHYRIVSREQLNDFSLVPGAHYFRSYPCDESANEARRKK